MPLPPVECDSLECAEQAEFAIRTAIVDCFLAVANNDRFGFSSDLVHPRLRYPDGTKSWEIISSIVDPDTVDEAPEVQTRLLRYFAVSFIGMSGSLRELKIHYAIKVSFGFKDVYKTDANRNSSDELVGCLAQYESFLAKNLSLGLDDRVTHEYLKTTNLRFVLKDKQGSAVMVADNTLTVLLTRCS